MNSFFDWSQIPPPVFERLCAALLDKAGFTNISWYGEAGSDKGRDVLAEKIDTPIPGVQRHEKWMIQCKRYTKARISKTEVKELLDASLEHSIDNLLLIVTTNISANVRDWLDKAKLNYPFKTYIWEELELRKEYNRHRSELLESIPELSSGKEPIWLYPVGSGEFRLGCNEFDEVEIVVSNVDTYEEAKKGAIEFLQYINLNGYDWWEK